ncbi:MAG: hypothetical protein U5L04_13175 [Trueperaceae bacterium]|nr:hypothetical protein [Trueperaceae bacterium]
MLLLVAGCNSGVKNEPASTPLPSERVARILGTTFANSTTQTARMVAHGDESALLPDYIEGFARRLSDDCPVTEGDLTDQDGDGFAVRQQIVYREDDCRFSVGEIGLELSGTILSEDDDDTDAASGFRFNTLPDAPLVLTQNDTEIFRAAYSLATTPSEMGFAVSEQTSLRYANIGSFDYDLAFDLLSDVPGERGSGPVEITGNLAWGYNDDDYALTVGSSDLLLDAGCTYGFASGTLTLSDNAAPPNLVTIEYRCNDYRVATEGLR